MTTKANVRFLVSRWITKLQRLGRRALRDWECLSTPLGTGLGAGSLPPRRS